MTKIAASNEKKEWDKYWTKKANKSQLVYKLIANFYRRYIIKRALNHFIESEFKKGSKLLHTGCGTGQVDKDILLNYKITALDISGEALKLYKFYNGDKAKLLQTSIFDIPVKRSTFDGVYNMG
jgi:ubiquinone/menaquinone biosynthesis C-methylase UbiE